MASRRSASKNSLASNKSNTTSGSGTSRLARKPPTKKRSANAAPTWYDGVVDFLGRLGAHSEEDFTEEKSKQVLNALSGGKPLCACKLQCLKDRIEFKKMSLFGPSPPKKQHFYRDITRFYVFSSEPKTIILGITEKQLKKHYFEAIRFKTTNEANKLCDLILAAKRDPHFELAKGNESARQSPDLRKRKDVTASPQPALKNKLVPAIRSPGATSPINGVSTAPVPRRNRVVDEYTSASSSSPSPQMVRKHISSPQRLATEEIIYTPRQNMNNRRNSLESVSRSSSGQLKRELSNPHLDEDAWAVDVKYIDTHPKYGSRISENGPIYMFIAHHLAPDRRGHSAISSRGQSPKLTGMDRRSHSALGNNVNEKSPIYTKHVPYGHW